MNDIQKLKDANRLVKEKYPVGHAAASSIYVVVKWLILLWLVIVIIVVIWAFVEGRINTRSVDFNKDLFVESAMSSGSSENEINSFLIEKGVDSFGPHVQRIRVEK